VINYQQGPTAVLPYREVLRPDMAGLEPLADMEYLQLFHNLQGRWVLVIGGRPKIAAAQVRAVVGVLRGAACRGARKSRLNNAPRWWSRVAVNAFCACYSRDDLHGGTW